MALFTQTRVSIADGRCVRVTDALRVQVLT
jgi:hypothetical protein